MRAKRALRHAPLGAYAAPVDEGAQEHAFCLRETIHLRMTLALDTYHRVHP